MQEGPVFSIIALRVILVQYIYTSEGLNNLLAGIRKDPIRQKSVTLSLPLESFGKHSMGIRSKESEGLSSKNLHCKIGSGVVGKKS